MGENVRRLRSRYTTEELARRAQACGLFNWGTARISELERGKVSPTVHTVYLLSLALGDLLGYPIPPDRLFDGSDGDTVSTPAGEIELAMLRTVLSKTPVERPKRVETAAEHYSDSARATLDLPDHLADQSVKLIRDTLAAMNDTDMKIARDLGVNYYRAAAGMAYCWQKPLSAQRNQEADEIGPDVSAQKKGRITLELKEQLREVLG
jgi:transcriptional regulator with XRE-family HTH domain